MSTNLYHEVTHITDWSGCTQVNLIVEGKALLTSTKYVKGTILPFYMASFSRVSQYFLGGSPFSSFATGSHQASNCLALGSLSFEVLRCNRKRSVLCCLYNLLVQLVIPLESITTQQYRSLRSLLVDTMEIEWVNSYYQSLQQSIVLKST